MSINLDNLEYIAKKATPGPWYADGPGMPGPDDTLTISPGDSGGVLAYVQPLWDDADYIAAFNPTQTLALIDRIRELEATIQRVRDARSNHPAIPECDRYTDDDAIKCGWKSAVESIDKALEGDPT